MQNMSFFKYICLILLCSLFILLSHYILFDANALDYMFSAVNLLTIIIALGYYYVNFKPKMLNYQSNKIENKFVIHSMVFGLIYCVILSYIFYRITGTLLDIEAADAKTYNELAAKMADNIKYKHFYDRSLLFRSFDDNGYFHLMAFIYYFTNNSITAFHIFQYLLLTLSIILIYRISIICFNNKKAAYISAIIAIPFPIFLIHASVLLKEIILAFFVLLFIYSFLEITVQGFRVKWIICITISLIVFSTMRFAYVLIILFSCILHLIFNLKRMIKTISQTLAASLAVVFIFLIISGKLGFKDEALTRGTAYISRITGYKQDERLIQEQRIGGQSINDNKIYRSAKKYGGMLLFVPFSLNFPFPTIVKTNVGINNPYQQTLKWYYVGGILLWNYLTYFVIIGIYISIKKYFKSSSILLFFVGLFTFMLLNGFLITSVRHNIPKIAALLPLIGLGIDFKVKNKFNYYIIYCIVITFSVIAYSYFKLKARM